MKRIGKYLFRLFLLLGVVIFLLTYRKEKPVTGSQPTKGDIEQALIVTIPLGDGADRNREELRAMYVLEGELVNAIANSSAGKLGSVDIDIDEGTFTMYAYGSSAEKLFDVALPVLVRYELPPGSRAVKRYGKPGAKEEVVSLSKGVPN